LNGQIKRKENYKYKVKYSSENYGHHLEKSSREIGDECFGYGQQSNQGDVSGKRTDNFLGP